MEKKYDVVALGELLVDFTPAGKSANGMNLFEQNPGGAPANMLATVCKAGLKTALIGKVGDDMHGHFLKKAVEDVGIDTSGLLTDGRYFTTLAFVSLGADGERSFAFARKPGADTQLCFQEVKKELTEQTRVFHIGSLSLTDEPARTATFEAVKAAKAAGAWISYDPNYRPLLWPDEDMAKEHMRSMLPYADMVKISDDETHLLTPYAAPEEAAAFLLEHGVKIAAVTLGSAGTLVACADGTERVPGYPSRAVDTTGAGDSFWGSFISRILIDEVDPERVTAEQLARCARYGNATASLCVERRGGLTSIPDMEDVLARMRCNSSDRSAHLLRRP